ncbi:hypothetical protein AGMMS49525_05320 [Bacteroidia bacterium]|nr:hypothetical protein AGMMS49525_05320 [Bacteroidia bacterium]
MSKLYVFGIGGTGARVLKSLTMLLAAGVKIDVDEIVPIVIDPDHAAADLTRTVKLMQDYNKIYNRIDHNNYNKNAFFGTKINLDIVPDVRMPLQNTENTDFQTYIGLPLMTNASGKHNANYALAKMLFSEKNLNATMEVGFKGNPNIGSVVLNQFAMSDEFKNFAASVGQDDRIFIISSIFGGTGASGFPLLLKNLRAIGDTQSGCENVKNAVIGAISVLPYFDVVPDNNPDETRRSEIDSATFISKTKAALSYYERNMTEANALYYIADNISKQYANSEGGTTQQNDAHLIELASALAIVDFAGLTGLSTSNGKPENIVYKEFGIKTEAIEIAFNDLDSETNSNIKKPLTTFTLFCKYLKEQLLDSYKSQPWAKDHKFDDNFLHLPFYKSELKDLREAYLQWLAEMANNVRAFKPFDLREKKSDVFSLITGEQPAKIMSLKSNYALFDDYLNTKQGKLKTDGSPEQIFVELFYNAIDELVKSKFRI